MDAGRIGDLWIGVRNEEPMAFVNVVRIMFASRLCYSTLSSAPYRDITTMELSLVP